MEAALASGVLLCLVPESTLMLTRATMLSPEGRSKTLDASADGYVRGETCRTLYLRPAGASQAGAAGQHALGLLLASAVNSNGRASSLTAPNGPAQQVLLRDGLRAAGARAVDVAGLQMHSNGTALGDPIEVGAASAVFLVSEQAGAFCSIAKRLDSVWAFMAFCVPELARDSCAATSPVLFPRCRRARSSVAPSCLPPSRAPPGTRSLAQAWRASWQPACWCSQPQHRPRCTCATSTRTRTALWLGMPVSPPSLSCVGSCFPDFLHF